MHMLKLIRYDDKFGSGKYFEFLLYDIVVFC